MSTAIPITSSGYHHHRHLPAVMTAFAVVSVLVGLALAAAPLSGSHRFTPLLAWTPEVVLAVPHGGTVTLGSDRGYVTEDDGQRVATRRLHRYYLVWERGSGSAVYLPVTDVVSVEDEYGLRLELRSDAAHPLRVWVVAGGAQPRTLAALDCRTGQHFADARYRVAAFASLHDARQALPLPLSADRRARRPHPWPAWAVPVVAAGA